MVVLVNAYSGVLTSFMTVPKFEKTVESLEDLSTCGRLRLTIENNSFVATSFLVGYTKNKPIFMYI